MYNVEVRGETDLLSSRAGRDVNSSSSCPVPASSLDRGTGVGVNRHSSNLHRSSVIVTSDWCLHTSGETVY